MDRLMKDLFILLGLPEWVAVSSLVAIFVYGQWKRHAEQREKVKSEKIQNFIEKLPQLRGPHKAILSEQLFLDRYGKALSYPEIQYFLSTKNPSLNIQRFLTARRYFDNSTDSPVILKSGFDTKKDLQLAKWFRILGYGVFAMIGLMMLDYSQQVFRNPPQVWVAFIYIVFFSLFLAYQCLDACIHIAAADKLRETLRLDNPASTMIVGR